MVSIEEAYRRHAQMVYQYLLSLCRQQDIAEELTQETFYQAIRCVDGFDNSCKFTTWLCAIAKNQYYAYVRKHPATEELDADMPSEASAEQTAMEKLQYTELLKKLHQCPEPYREVLHLRLLGELSFREIGDIFGKTENWARVTFYRGKEKPRREIGKNEG